MQNYKKCVHVTDLTRIGYWQRHDAVSFYQFGNELVPVQPGDYTVWTHAGDRPLMDIMDADQFDLQYVTEDNLPRHLSGLLADMPSYEDWVNITREDNNNACQ